MILTALLAAMNNKYFPILTSTVPTLRIKWIYGKTATLSKKKLKAMSISQDNQVSPGLMNTLSTKHTGTSLYTPNGLLIYTY